MINITNFFCDQYVSAKNVSNAVLSSPYTITQMCEISDGDYMFRESSVCGRQHQGQQKHGTKNPESSRFIVAYKHYRMLLGATGVLDTLEYLALADTLMHLFA